jgi:hypothetical protein
MLLHIKQNNTTLGPYALDRVQFYLNQGTFEVTTLARAEGTNVWAPLSTFITSPSIEHLKENKPSTQLQQQFEQPLEGAVVAGVLIAFCGIVATIYFLFIFRTTVHIPGEILPGAGYLPGKSVYNQGLLQDRMLGSIAGMVACLIGTAIAIWGRKRK